MKKALITGALGQDGSYLSEYLLGLGYEVWGTVRMQPELSPYWQKGVHYIHMELADELSIAEALRKSQPNEVYNLAGQVFVPTSWGYPHQTMDINAGGLARILECIETMKMQDIKVYQASTSEMFGNALTTPGIVALDEDSPMHPVSPYGISKLAAHKLVDVYRQRGMFVAAGILFNHESPRRGTEMVTRKITRHVARWAQMIRLGHDRLEHLELGAVTKRDWGFAGDYVQAMHAMLQQSEPDDFVIGTGKAHSVLEFVEEAIKAAHLNDSLNDLVKWGCPQFGRNPELNTLVADSTKAHTVLGWYPKTSFSALVTAMVTADCTDVELNLFYKERCAPVVTRRTHV